MSKYDICLSGTVGVLASAHHLFFEKFRRSILLLLTYFFVPKCYCKSVSPPLSVTNVIGASSICSVSINENMCVLVFEMSTPCLVFSYQ
ncbi:unnamed protein product [Caenorhabditis nigoni]